VYFIVKLKVLLAVHRNIAVQQEQQDALIIFSLLRLIVFTCFQRLFAHHQEALYIQQLVCFVCVLCRLAASRGGMEFHSHPPIRTQNIPLVLYTAPPDDELINARNV
jgi:ferredoxin-like protein FixX